MLLSMWSGRCGLAACCYSLVAREIVRSSRLAGAAGINVFAWLVKRPAQRDRCPRNARTTLNASWRCRSYLYGEVNEWSVA
jgi:hypothetical protein